MFLYVSADLTEFGRGKSKVAGEADRLEPELRFEIVTGDMNVRRLVVFSAIEMKAVGSDAEHGGHDGM